MIIFPASSQENISFMPLHNFRFRANDILNQLSTKAERKLNVGTANMNASICIYIKPFLGALMPSYAARSLCTIPGEGFFVWASIV